MALVKLIMKENEGKIKVPERKKFGDSKWKPKNTNIFAKFTFWKEGSREPCPL
jgi:hypothetical protein